MTYHVTVGEVNTKILILTGLETLDELIGDLSTLHPGSLLEGYYIRGNLDIGLELLGELTGLVTVPEIGNVTVLLSLGDSKLANANGAKVLGHSIGNLGRIINQILL